MKRRDFVKVASVGSLATGASLLQAPAVHAKKKIKWKMVTTWPKNFPGLGTGANALAEMITKMSDKRLKVKVYGAGEIVPALEVFDAVSNGTAQMGHGVPYYWKGKHEAFQFFGAVPFGLNAQEAIAWVQDGGGQELWDELCSGFGLLSFPAGNTGVQMGGWFNKEIKSAEDYKGLKMRMPGLGAEVIKRAGATPVSLPGGEIFQALQSGAIDATEWVGPYNDLAFGFYKAAKFYYWPGWHEPGALVECMVNKKAYDDLPKELRHVVKNACQAAYTKMLSEFTARNNTALQTLVQQHNVQLKRFPDSLLKKMGTLSQEVVADVAAQDKFTQKVHESFSKFRTNAMEWNRIGEVGYSLARSLSS